MKIPHSAVVGQFPVRQLYDPLSRIGKRYGVRTKPLARRTLRGLIPSTPVPWRSAQKLAVEKGNRPRDNRALRRSPQPESGI